MRSAHFSHPLFTAVLKGLLPVFLALYLMLLDTAEVSAKDKEIPVGVLAPRGELIARQNWQPTFEWLNQQIDGVEFTLHPLNLTNMAQAVEQRHLDFIITNPGQAVQLGRRFELSWIASQNMSGMGSHGIGSALVVKKDSGYHRISDLYHKPIAAVSEEAFGGYLTLVHHLFRKGLDPIRFFSDVHFLGYPVDASLYQLRDGVVDAAVVPVCLLEQMDRDGLLNGDEFRVLAGSDGDVPSEKSGLRMPEPGSPTGNHCRATTALYPNWSIARTAHGDIGLAKRIGQALLAMPSDHSASQSPVNAVKGWIPPVSLLSVDQLYETLDLHPLVRPLWQQVLRWLNSHRDWALMMLSALLLMVAYHFWLQMRFKQSRIRLTETLSRLAEKQGQLEHAQRVSIVGELGTSIAHEINQPLSAIRNYTESVRTRLKKQLPADKITPVLDQVVTQLDRTDAIIERLRSLIKRPEVSYQSSDLQALITECAELIKHQLNEQGIELQLNKAELAENLWLDRTGMQQVFVNLFSNAIDACTEYQTRHATGEYKGRILVEIESRQESVMITVTDNGTGLLFEGYPRAFLTTKNEGLGLGLTISRDIVERQSGTLRIRNHLPHGCEVSLELPRHRHPSKK